MRARHLREGEQAERLALTWLRQRGLQTLTLNFRCKAGELDAVMLDGECLVIVEVRYRRSRSRGGALASVTHVKQRRLLTATRVFLQRNPGLAARPLRFDVIALTGMLPDPEIDWVRNAFYAD